MPLDRLFVYLGTGHFWWMAMLYEFPYEMGPPFVELAHGSVEINRLSGWFIS